MKQWPAKIIFIIAAGLLFSHQLIAHHHHEEIEFETSHHETDHHDDDHDSGHFPTHHIDQIFSVQTATVLNIRSTVQDIQFDLHWKQIIPCTVVLGNKKHPYYLIRPPLLEYYKYYSLRAPPAC